MAERRMMTKKVTDDDHFVNLSASAQALYLHLNMSADDDGFCNTVNACMFKAHASVEDLKSLLENRYLFQFENGVIVIKHWRMANALRKDRYTPTDFEDEMKLLELKPNGAYTLAERGEVAAWLPLGCQMVATGKDRLGKDRLDIDTLSGKPDDLTIKAKLVLDALNQKSGKAFRYTDSNLRLIEARLKDYTVEDCLKVIATKCSQWKNDPKMNKYIRPETLFNATKFGGYLEEQEVKTSPQYTGASEDTFEW